MPFYQHPQYKRVYGDTLLTPVGRLVWPALVTPKEPPPPQEGQAPGRPRYEVTWLSEGTAGLEEFMLQLDSMVRAMLAQYNTSVSAKLAEITDLLQDGGKMDPEKYPFYKNNVYLIARSSWPSRKPGETKGWQVKNRNKEVIDPADVKGGMLGRLLVTPHIGPTGVSYRIELIQVTGDDGVRYGGAARDHDAMLTALDGEEEESSLGKGLDAAIEEKPLPVPPQAVSVPYIPPVTPVTPVPQVHGAGGAVAPKIVGALSPKQLQQQIKEKAAQAVAAQNAGAVGLRTGKGKGAAIDNL